MKQLQRGLQSISKSLKALTQKVEKTQKRIEKSEIRPAKTKTKSAKPKPVKKAPRIKLEKPDEGATAYSLFLKVLEDSDAGVSKAELKSKTGFNDKKIANLVYKAKKQGKIKPAGRGVYVKA